MNNNVQVKVPHYNIIRDFEVSDNQESLHAKQKIQIMNQSNGERPHIDLKHRNVPFKK